MRGAPGCGMDLSHTLVSALLSGAVAAAVVGPLLLRRNTRLQESIKLQFAQLGAAAKKCGPSPMGRPATHGGSLRTAEDAAKLIERPSMQATRILGEVLPVLGTIGLLGLWLYQQTEIEKRTSELRKLASARTVYQTYQSNNALFNAINEVATTSEKSPERLRVFQVYNYELGLRAIEDVLSDADKAGIPPAVSAYDGTTAIDAKMEVTQKRLEILQGRLEAREKAIAQAAAVAKTRYLWGFIALSLLSITGAVCKILSKPLGP